MKTIHIKITLRICGVLSFMLGAIPTLAQEPSSSVVIGERLEFRSTILDEQREILIGKPSTYDSGEDSYPVLYLLDGESHFHHVTGLINFLARDQQIPEMLVVAIPNTDRNRDLTPSSTNSAEVSEYPTHGGADDFRKFLIDELMPLVEENYRTKSYKLLVGHSFGGLFILNSLLEAPGSFDGYIALSPALQWDNQGLTPVLEEYFRATNELQADLYIAKGNESPALLPGFSRLVSSLDNSAIEGFRWNVEELSEESHTSVPYRGFHRGLEFIFEDWVLEDPMSIFNEEGLSGLTEHYTQAGKRFGYERNLSANTLLTLFGQLGSDDRLEEAAEVLALYETQYSPQAFLYAVLAEGFVKREQIDHAINNYEKALKLDPDNQYYKNTIAELGR